MYFNKKANIELFDISGQKLLSQKEALTNNTTNFASELYILKTDDGLTIKLIIR